MSELFFGLLERFGKIRVDTFVFQFYFIVGSYRYFWQRQFGKSGMFRRKATPIWMTI